jgi:hypothetical protein
VPTGCVGVGVGVGVGVFLEQLAKIKIAAKMGKDIFILPSYNIANKRAVELAAYCLSWALCNKTKGPFPSAGGGPLVLFSLCD